MERTQDKSRLFLAAFAVFAGIWLFVACFCFPPSGRFAALAAGLLCGSGVCYLLYAWSRKKEQDPGTTSPVATLTPPEPPPHSGGTYPYPYFLLVMAVIEGHDPTDGEDPPDPHLVWQIGGRLMGAVDLPEMSVTTALLDQYIICYINYKTNLAHTMEQLSQIKRVLEVAHKTLLDEDGIAVTFLISDVNLSVNELNDGIQQLSDLDWYMHIFSYRPTQSVVSLEHIQQHVQSSEENAASFQSRNMLQLKKQFISCFLDKNYVSAKRLINEIMTRSVMEQNVRSLLTYRVAFEGVKGLLMDATEAVRLQLDIPFFSSIFPDYGINEVASMPELQERCNYIFDRLIEHEQGKSSQALPEHYLQICNYVDTHICDPTMNISTIALALGTTAAFVSRVFKSYRGIPLLDYIHICRVNRAKELLNAGKSITEASELTGFGSVRTFSRAFQKIEGVNPGAWRESSKTE